MRIYLALKGASVCAGILGIYARRELAIAAVREHAGDLPAEKIEQRIEEGVLIGAPQLTR
jgi:hypothetical protein